MHVNCQGFVKIIFYGSEGGENCHILEYYNKIFKHYVYTFITTNNNLCKLEQVSKDITTPSPPLTNQKEKPFFVENYHKLYIILKKIICTNWLK